MGTLSGLLARVDELIKQGNGAQAREDLHKLKSEEIPREDALTLAALSRRAFEPQIGIKVLNPIVRPTRKAPATATEEEKAEYAACLARFGAPEEGLDILKEIDSEKHPQVLLFQSLALATQWHYEMSIPLLQRYIEKPVINDYQKTVAKVNLAAAYVYERRHAEAHSLLEAIADETRRQDFSLLNGNILHLLAINYVFQRKWEEAEKCLSDEEEVLRKANRHDKVLLGKWRAILDLMKQGPNPATLSAIRSVREEAKTLKNWETIRDCDRFEASATGDEGLLFHLYFGTPFEGFRKWLLLGFGRAVEIPSEYLWRLGKGGKHCQTLDLTSPLSPKGAKKLEPGELLYRLLVALSSDFYSPVRLATLHFRLYPKEFYNPETSPIRVHQTLTRFRSWCADGKIPFIVGEEAGFYRLDASQALGIRIGRKRIVAGKREGLLVKIHSRWKDEPFSMEEVAQFLEISKRSVARVLDEAKRQGKVEKIGHAPSTKFRVRGL